MRKILLLLFCVSTNFIFSQGKSIEKFIYKSDYEYLEHLHSPKSIFIENYEFDNKGKKKNDLSNNYKAIYDSRNQIIKHLVYSKNSQNPFKVTTYDSLNRISKVEINRENGNGEIVLQYFNRDLQFPDSLKIFSKEMVERSRIINHFKDNLIKRRDLIEKDTLRYYSLFEYDSKNNLIKELNINTKNGFGVINKLGYSTTKTLNPNNSTLYNHTKAGDTIIINRERYLGLVVTEKNYENDNVVINIEEQTSTKSGLTFQKSTNFKWKDSTKIEHKYFKDKYVLESYYSTYIYQDKIISKWINPIMMDNGEPEKQEVTQIQTTFDKKGNWIKKTYIRNEFKVKEVIRTIEYF
ncbi:hypothetical protein [Flavobacterium sp. Arc2]|uniref:hypothetical protein n=1 Tax=Flavobacterium sp. Arc2 TaxID=3046685 RepID=UPI00352F0C15